MKRITRQRTTLFLATTLGLSGLTVALLPSRARTQQSRPAAITTAQKTFTTPEAAVKGLVSAVKSKSNDALFAILGEEMRPVLSTGNVLQDDGERYAFLQAARITRIETESANPNRRLVLFGEEEWPFPAPLVKVGTAWRFDSAAGREEVEDRRIGGNELSAIDACYGYFDAQLIYSSEDQDGDGVLEFAQKIVSTPNHKDGLYWNNDNGEDLSPLGLFFANADAAIDQASVGNPLNGYRFKILTAQGENAIGGAHSFINSDGNLMGGFALVAYPAEYGKTGVVTFIINQQGIVYEKDLGADTKSGAQSMTAFNPDATWKRTED